MAKRVYLSDVLAHLNACQTSQDFARSRRGERGGLYATYLAAHPGWIDWLADRLNISFASRAAYEVYLDAPDGSAKERAAVRRVYPYRVILAALRSAAHEVGR